MIDEETKNKIIKQIEAYEYHLNGMKHVNGGCVDVENVEIDEEENEVRCKITLEYQGDQKSVTYNNCQYPLDEILKRIV